MRLHGDLSARRSAVFAAAALMSASLLGPAYAAPLFTATVTLAPVTYDPLDPLNTLAPDAPLSTNASGGYDLVAGTQYLLTISGVMSNPNKFVGGTAASIAGTNLGIGQFYVDVNLVGSSVSPVSDPTD